MGAFPLDGPVSGGCHRAASGNIAILVGEIGKHSSGITRSCIVGREILHTGELGSTSVLKVMTNYLATANLVAYAKH